MSDVIPDNKRRYLLREYNHVGVRFKKLFQIPINEMILDIKWNKETNKLEIETIIDFDVKLGDI